MYMATSAKTYSTAEAARKAGIHRDTLLRWLREGKVAEPRRDRRGWRVFSDHDVQQICSYASSGNTDGSGSSEEVINKLQGMDWDFHGANTSYLTHAIHPYPAKFIPQIPNVLIQELSSVGDTVLDLFCGSGTTLVEAQLLRRHSIGIDANPIACLISRAKLARISEDQAQPLFDLAAKAEAVGEELSTPTGDLFGFTSGDGRASVYPRPESEAIDFWFEPFVIEELAAARAWIAGLPGITRIIAEAALSSIIVAVSRQDSDTRYVRRDKRIRPGDALRRFSKALSSAVRASLRFTELTDERFAASVISADVLSEPNIEPVDLVVTSPPYPNAYSYHLYHMTRMLWLGMDEAYANFRRQEIGSHRKYSSRGKNGATVATFSSEFSRILSWLRPKLKDNKYACFIVGDSTIKGERIDNAELISSIGEKIGYREVARIERRLQATRKAFNPKIGKIKNEKILILQKK